ncbi:hypothetical protein HMN09_01244800 [Mycena chlorophos]|uniref:Fungal-type protein kinase domain-containing protein n=1 Tax=Mycena chlorophos TaxID=658473 RepID=A0A8H6S342_MYCCL|nr:hypothetical protein HMN09_01244800 [Mycena chlorophos]
MRRRALANSLTAPETPPRRGSAPTLHPTPHHTSSNDGAYASIREVRAFVGEELRDACISEGDDKAFQKHLVDLLKASDRGIVGRIKKWVKDGGLYDKTECRWSGIPETGSPESAYYKPLVRLLNAILEEFGYDEHKDGTNVVKRRFVDTHNVPLAHRLEDKSPDAAKKLRSVPDILSLGTGPSATSFTRFPERASYDHVCAIWEVKLTNTFLWEQFEQLAAYAREVFVQQPNRRYVHASLLTPTEIRVLRFDRAGCYHTLSIDYHLEPELFVKLVLVVNSFDERLAGFDTTVYFENGQRKLRMVVAEIYDAESETWIPNSGEEPLVFVMDEQDSAPLFYRHSIRSRGTVCWLAKCEKWPGISCVVKDYWRATERVTESEFLRTLSAVKGVGQMLAYQNDRETVCELRKVDAMPVATDADRSFMRVVVRDYPYTLDQALSPRELLEAVVDIVDGHSVAVLDHDLLQRDISHTNLRLSLDTDVKGVIIDWDLAKDIQNQKLTKGDLRTGTQAFKSCKTLYENAQLGAPDHMDDLESILYVVFNVLCNFDSRGRPLPTEEIPETISDWHSPDRPSKLAALKQSFLLSGLKSSWTVTRFPKHADRLLQLLEKLKEFFRPRIELVDAALCGKGTIPRWDREAARADYDVFLAILREAIDVLPEDPDPESEEEDEGEGEEDDQQQPVASGPKLPIASSSGSTGTRSSKRSREDDSDDEDNDDSNSQRPSTPPRKRRASPTTRNSPPRYSISGTSGSDTAQMVVEPASVSEAIPVLRRSTRKTGKGKERDLEGSLRVGSSTGASRLRKSTSSTSASTSSSRRTKSKRRSSGGART